MPGGGDRESMKGTMGTNFQASVQSSMVTPMIHLQLTASSYLPTFSKFTSWKFSLTLVLSCVLRQDSIYVPVTPPMQEPN